MSSTRRARKEEQKEERRQFIIDAAWLLFQETSFAAVTMAQVAERTRLAKGTLYLYFTTKEELFLAVIEQQLSAWFDHVDARLEPLVAELHDASGIGSRPDRARCGAQSGAPSRDAPWRIAALLSSSLEEHQAMMRLLTILHGILDQNVSYEAALRFKLSLLHHINRTGTLLERCLPFLAPGQGGRLLIRVYALVIGLRQVCEPAPVIREVRARPEMAPFQVNFADEVRASIASLVGGSERA